MRNKFVISDGVEYYSEFEFEALKKELEEAKAARAKIIDECRRNELRHGEMIESLVNALARHKGHSELLKDARVYLNIIFHGFESVKAFTDYREEYAPTMDDADEEFVKAVKKKRKKK